MRTMSYGFKIIVEGDYACFTRPELKVERVSYDVPTPGALEGLLKSVYWKPAIRYVIDKIIVFQDIDILEHHEPQQDCMGCMCVNAGDRNTVRNIRFEDIYVEHMEHGRLFDLRIICGRYNSAPGRLIENIFFKNIRFCCDGEEISRIS